MTPLPFWQLMVALVALLIIGRLVSGWIWQAVRRAGPRFGYGVTYLARRRNIAATISRRWPRATALIGGRVAVDRFSGLPLTLMMVLALYLVFLGAGLAEDVIEGDQIVAFDRRVNDALAILRNPTFLHVVAAITQFANPATLVAVGLVSMGFLWADQRPYYIPGLLLSALGSQAITYIGKYAVDRHRPDFLTFASASTPSFPSAHATGAIAVYGFIIYAIGRDTRSPRERFELAYWGVALIALIAASRAVLSVHFTSDIAAGLLSGAFWLLAGFAFTEYLYERTGRYD